MKNMIKVGNCVFKAYLIDSVTFNKESCTNNNETTYKYCLMVFLTNKPCSVRVEFATEKEALDSLKEISEL